MVFWYMSLLFFRGNKEHCKCLNTNLRDVKDKDTPDNLNSLAQLFTALKKFKRIVLTPGLACFAFSKS